MPFSTRRADAGADLHELLDAATTSFLAEGGTVARSSVALSLRCWMPAEEVRWLENERPRIQFLPYDWSLACRVVQPPVASTLSAGIDTRISPRKSPTA